MKLELVNKHFVSAVINYLVRERLGTLGRNGNNRCMNWVKERWSFCVMSNTLLVDVVFYSHVRTYSTKGSCRQNKILVCKEGTSLAIYDSSWQDTNEMNNLKNYSSEYVYM